MKSSPDLINFDVFQIPISAIAPFRDGRSTGDKIGSPFTDPLRAGQATNPPHQSHFRGGMFDQPLKPEPRERYPMGGAKLSGSPGRGRGPSPQSRGGGSMGRSSVTSQLGGMGKKVVSMSVKHVCSVCNKEFQTQSGLWKHSSVHTGKFSYNCNVCGKGFNEKHMYEGHMNMHEGVGFTCMRCKKTFGLKSQLLAHQKKCSAW